MQFPQLSPMSSMMLVQPLCGGLDENCPIQAPIFEHLVPSGGAIWGVLHGAALLEKSCHRGVVLEIVKPCPPSSSISLLCACGGEWLRL